MISATIYRLLVVGEAQVGQPSNRRRAVSMQVMAVGRDLSTTGITTRKRDHDSQAQNSSVSRPATTGPWL